MKTIIDLEMTKEIATHGQGGGEGVQKISVPLITSDIILNNRGSRQTLNFSEVS